MDRKKRGRLIGVMGTLGVHAAIIALLLLLGFTPPEHTEESGIEVMMGNVESAYGGFEPSSLVDVDVLPEPELPAEAEPTPPTEQDLLTQETEETVVVEPKAEPKKETPKKETPKKPEKTEAELAEEARRIEAEKAERERRATAEAADRKVAGAFGKGAQMGDKGTGTGTGVEGSPTGNAATGATTGTGGKGEYDLGGRSIEGNLPLPVCNVQEEGRVVVSIKVNSAGKVIATEINLSLTKTVNLILRKAAEDAAQKARFETIDGAKDQTGTITYYFKLN
jgi:TonB family protein